MITRQHLAVCHSTMHPAFWQSHHLCDPLCECRFHQFCKRASCCEVGGDARPRQCRGGTFFCQSNSAIGLVKKPSSNGFTLLNHTDIASSNMATAVAEVAIFELAISVQFTKPDEFLQVRCKTTYKRVAEINNTRGAKSARQRTQKGLASHYILTTQRPLACERLRSYGNCTLPHACCALSTLLNRAKPRNTGNQYAYPDAAPSIEWARGGRLKERFPLTPWDDFVSNENLQ